MRFRKPSADMKLQEGTWLKSSKSSFELQGKRAKSRRSCHNWPITHLGSCRAVLIRSADANSMNSHDAAEELDWPPNCSQSVICQALDEAAHCSICRDFFNTPLSLLCGHSCEKCFLITTSTSECCKLPKATLPFRSLRHRL